MGCADGPKEQPKPKFTISKDTTYVTVPVDKDGYIDYEAALNERLGKGIKPEENANVLLWKALGPRPEGGDMPAEYFERLGIEELPEKGEYFVGLHRYARDQLKLDPEAIDALFKDDRASQRPWSAEQYPVLAGWLDKNEKPLAVAIEATRRPRYYNPLVTKKTEKGSPGLMSVLLPSVQKCRELTNALVNRAMLHLNDGKLDAAWQDLLACHRLARLMRQGGTLIEALVGIAIEQTASGADLAFIAHPKLTSAQVQSCLRDLQNLLPTPSLADQIDIGERFMFLDTTMMVCRHGPEHIGKLHLGKIGGGGAKEPNFPMRHSHDSVDWDVVLRKGNRFYDRFVAAMRIKERAARDYQLAEIENEFKNLQATVKNSNEFLPLIGLKGSGRDLGERYGDIMLAVLAPALRKVQAAADRVEQVEHNLQVAFALAAYQRDEGRYPAKLDELAPKYLPQVPGDIFSGKALIYKPAEKGYLLYSVGPNGQDDGGQLREANRDSDDLVVRMPLPEVKR